MHWLLKKCPAEVPRISAERTMQIPPTASVAASKPAFLLLPTLKRTKTLTSLSSFGQLNCCLKALRSTKWVCLTKLQWPLNQFSKFSFWQCILCYTYFQYSWSKRQFSASTHFSISEKSIFRHKFLPKRAWLFPVSTFKMENFNRKMSSLAGLNKK